MKTEKVVSKKEVVDKSKVKKGFYYNKVSVKRKIKTLWDTIPTEFFDKEKDWYWTCHKWCQELADEKGLDLMCVCGLFSALSIQNSYSMNKVFCRAYLEGIPKHTRVVMNKCDHILAMYGISAYEARKQATIETLGGLKTANFFEAILEPFNRETIVIDRHMLIIAGIEQKSVTVKQYNFLKECYLELAKEVDTTGNIYQAVLWSWYRSQKFSHDSYG